MPELSSDPSTLARGGAASIAYYAISGSGEKPGVVFLGGFRSDMTGIKALAIERHCRLQGQACLRFDYQGHGVSTGSVEDGTIGLWLEDALAVLDRLTTGPQILVGSSMGGWLALLASLARPTRVVGIVGIAPATDFTEALVWPNLNETERATLMNQGRIALPSEYDPAGYVFTRRMIEEARAHLILDDAIRLAMPVRLLHGMNDAAIPWPHSVRLVERLTSTNVRLTLVKDGDHRLSREADIALLLDAISELSGYLAIGRKRG